MQGSVLQLHTGKDLMRLTITMTTSSHSSMQHKFTITIVIAALVRGCGQAPLIVKLTTFFKQDADLEGSLQLTRASVAS